MKSKNRLEDSKRDEALDLLHALITPRPLVKTQSAVHLVSAEVVPLELPGPVLEGNWA